MFQMVIVHTTHHLLIRFGGESIMKCLRYGIWNIKCVKVLRVSGLGLLDGITYMYNTGSYLHSAEMLLKYEMCMQNAYRMDFGRFVLITEHDKLNTEH